MREIVVQDKSLACTFMKYVCVFNSEFKTLYTMMPPVSCALGQVPLGWERLKWFLRKTYVTR